MPASTHRLELGDGRDLAGFAHLDVNAQQPGDGLLGLVLECDGPARALAPRAQPLALAQIVDLHDQAVGLEIELVAFVVPALGVLDHLLDRIVNGRVGAHRDAPAFHELGHRVVGRLFDALVFAQAVRDEPQPALGHYLGIKHLERASRRIAGVGKRDFLGGEPQFVEPDQLGIGHVHLAAHFQEQHGAVLQRERDLARAELVPVLLDMQRINMRCSLALK